MARDDDSWWDAVGGGVKWDSYCDSLVKWFDKNQKQMGVSKGLQSCKVKFCNLMIEDAKPYAMMSKKESEYNVIFDLTGKSQTPKSIAKFKKDNPAKFKKAMAKDLADRKKYYAKNESLVSTIKKKSGFNAYKNSAWSKWYNFNNTDAQYLYHTKQGKTELWDLMEALHNIREKNKIGAKDKKALMHWKIKTNFKPLKTKATSKKKTTTRKRKAPVKKKTTTRKKKAPVKKRKATKKKTTRKKLRRKD